jgi:hypothetical protein
VNLFQIHVEKSVNPVLLRLTKGYVKNIPAMFISFLC